jgi:NAD(P)-dependent dehydrogenase (short-subunit alcohol dehydrogenase family)
VLDRHGRIDVLVNNAGRGVIGAVEETTNAELRDLMNLHFFGPVALTRAVLPHMRERGSGAVVQMSSMGGRFTFPGAGAYSATKFALEGWSEALAKEGDRFGIRVLIVEPGAFRTSFNGSGALQISEAIADYDELIGPVRSGMAEDDGSNPATPRRRRQKFCMPSIRPTRRCGWRSATTPSTRFPKHSMRHKPSLRRGNASGAKPRSIDSLSADEAARQFGGEAT